MKKICSILLALILAIMPLTLCAAESTGKVTLHYYCLLYTSPSPRDCS